MREPAPTKKNEVYHTKAALNMESLFLTALVLYLFSKLLLTCSRKDLFFSKDLLEVSSDSWDSDSDEPVGWLPVLPSVGFKVSVGSIIGGLYAKYSGGSGAPLN